METLTTTYMLIAFHALGDYVLQPDILAKTKGENWWHLLMHCILYTLPFSTYFGLDYKIIIILLTHIIIDALKARWNKINYITDQALHLIILITLYVVIPR